MEGLEDLREDFANSNIRSNNTGIVINERTGHLIVFLGLFSPTNRTAIFEYCVFDRDMVLVPGLEWVPVERTNMNTAALNLLRVCGLCSFVTLGTKLYALGAADELLEIGVGETDILAPTGAGTPLAESGIVYPYCIKSNVGNPNYVSEWNVNLLFVTADKAHQMAVRAWNPSETHANYKPVGTITSWTTQAPQANQTFTGGMIFPMSRTAEFGARIDFLARVSGGYGWQRLTLPGPETSCGQVAMGATLASQTSVADVNAIASGASWPNYWHLATFKYGNGATYTWGFLPQTQAS